MLNIRKKLIAFLLCVVLFASMLPGLYGCGDNGSADIPSETGIAAETGTGTETGKETPAGIPAGDTGAVTDGNWLLTGEWTVERADSGDETLSVAAEGDSTAWNTFFTLAEDWTVSADMQLTARHGADCTRLVFGDSYGNVVLAASVEYRAGNEIVVRADEFISSGWRSVYLSREKVTIDPEKPVNLEVRRKSGGKKLEITCSQDGKKLDGGSTRTLQDRMGSMVTRPGLNVNNAEARFTGFSVAAKRSKVKKNEDETIVAGENVPTDEWILGENAVHNLLNGESALILDGEGEVHAWNAVNTLGDAWTLSFTTEFGTSYRDSVCSRYMFGPAAADDGDYVGLVTVSFSRNQIMLQIEDKIDGGWMTTGGVFDWKSVSGRKVKIQIVKYAGINRIAVLIYDGDRLVIQEFSDEMAPEQIARYKHYGVMTFSSQCRFSGFGFEETADESLMPSMTERVFDCIDDITVGEAETTADWQLSRNSTYFHEDGRECMVINSKGDEFSYYLKNSLGDTWSISTDVNFGTYYSSTAGARVAFTTPDTKLVALMTVKYAPGDANISLQLQTMTNDIWSDVIKTGWTEGESSLRFDISGGSDGRISIVISSARTGEVLMDYDAVLEPEIVARMQVAALATTSTQVKYSDIHMNLTGPAVAMGAGGAVIAVGENLPTSEWILGKGAVHNLLDGQSAIIVDGEGANYAWNAVNTLGDSWTLTFITEFGTSLRDSVCSRIMFGRAAAKDAEYIGLVTVNYTGGQVILQIEDNDGAWAPMGGEYSWQDISGSKVKTQIIKYPGINRLAVLVYDGDRLVIQQFSDEMTAAQMAKYRHYGVMSYSSQCRFSGFGFEETADESVMPEMTEKVYPRVDEFTAGEAESTRDWRLSRNSVWFREDGKECMVIDSKGDEFSYYVRNGLGDSWTIGADVNFGTYYGSVPGARVAFTGADSKLAGLMTLKYSPSDGNISLQLQSFYNDIWTDMIKTDWRPGCSKPHLEIKGNSTGWIYIRITDSENGAVLLNRAATFPRKVVDRMKVAALATTSTQVRYSDIRMNLSGPAVHMTGGSAGGGKGSGTMYSMSYGTPSTDTVWDTGEGMTFYTNNSLIVSSSDNRYSYNRSVEVADGFSVSTDIIFGSLDAKGLCTARIALVDKFFGMAGLVTVKFSDNFEIMVEGQYNSHTVWYSCIYDNSWRGVASNRVHVTLSRPDGSSVCYLSITDSAGSSVFYAALSMPEDAAKKICYIGLGVDKSTAQFLNMQVTATEVEGGNQNDFDMIPVEPTGTELANSRDWTDGDGITFYDDGSMIITAEENQYSYKETTEVADGFSVSVDVLFGKLDEKGLSTARIAMVDKFRSMAGLVTVKFSQNFEVMVEGQYNSHSEWYSCISDNSWRKVQDNRIHVTLSRKDGENSCTLTIKDFSGKTVFSEVMEMPADAAKKICYLGLGVDKSSAQFSNIKVTATEVEGGNQNTYDMIPIEETGTALGSSADWSAANGVTVYSDGSLILDSNAGVYSNRLGVMLDGGFYVSAKIQFGRLDSKGLSTARLGLVNSSNKLLTLFTMKYSQNTEVLVEGEYNDDGWTKIITDNAWRKVADNIITVKVTRKAGENRLHFVLTDSAGKTFYDVMTDPIPDSILAAYNSFCVGVSDTEVKFSDIKSDAKKDATEVEEIEIGELAMTDDWTLGDGALYSVDDDGRGSIVLYKSGSDASAQNNAALNGRFTFDTDIVFGTSDNSGNVNARIYLTDASGRKLVRYYLTYTAKHELQITATYNSGSSWETFASAGCSALRSNHIRVRLTNETQDGLLMSVSGKDGGGLASVSGSKLPADLLKQINSLVIGTSASRAMFCNMSLKVSEIEQIEIGELAETGEWTLGDGALYSVDEGGNGSLILYQSGAEATATSNTDVSGDISFDADVVFGDADSSGNVNVRLYLTDGSGNKLVRIYITYTANGSLKLSAGFKGTDGWESTDSAGASGLTSNRVRVHLTVSAENGMQLRVCNKNDASLAVLRSEAVPAEVAGTISRLVIGTTGSRAQFGKLQLTVTLRETEENGAEEDGTDMKSGNPGENL